MTERVRALQGRMSVSSEPGSGTLISLELPAALDPAPVVMTTVFTGSAMSLLSFRIVHSVSTGFVSDPLPPIVSLEQQFASRTRGGPMIKSLALHRCGQ